MAAIQQLPPEVQQQVMPLIQQLMNMPAQEREQHLQELLQQMEALQGGTPTMQAAPQGMEAQASAEDLFAAAQQGGMAPSGAMGGEEPIAGLPQQDSAEQDAETAEASAIEAKNELDNVKVTLTVRELLDLIGKGSATASLLKVKQLADTHKQKMEQTRQKAETDQKQQAQDQAAQQDSMMSGGIYPSPMGGGPQQ